MQGMIHPLTGHRYEITDDGELEVFDDEAGISGRFDADGRNLGGELRVADPHMCVWMIGHLQTATVSGSKGNL